MHTLDVLGGGLQAHEHYLLAGLSLLNGVLGGEDDLAAGGSGRGGQSAGYGCGGLQGCRVELGMQQSVQLLGIDHQKGLLLGLHALVDKVTGDFDGGCSSALAVAGLQHVELAVLHGELHVLHILIVVLKKLADLLELLEGLGELLCHLGDGHGSAHAGHNVLALGVGEELAHQLLLAGGGVAGKGDASAAVIAHVAEGHHLHVNGGAPAVGYLVHAAVHVGAGVVPGTEHGLDGAHELLLGVGGEVCADLLLILGLELLSQLLQVVLVQLGVLGNALLLLHLVDELLEILLAHLHDHVGIHLDKPAVGVIGEAGVTGLLGESLHHLVVEAQVEDGIHHAGHGGPCAGADGDQQGIVQVPELFPAHVLQLAHIRHNFVLDFPIDGTSILIILGTCLGGDGKTLRDGHTQIGHFGQVRALAAQQLPHRAVALGKEVHKFFLHLECFLLSFS